MDYTAYMEQEISRLEDAINHLQQLLVDTPAGNLEYRQDGRRIKWYHSLKQDRRYIQAKDRPLAEALALKTYRIRLLQEYQTALKAAQAYVRIQGTGPKRKAASYLSNPVYHALLAPHFPDMDVIAWANAAYPQNPYHPEKKNIQAACGIFVRSKSEAIICDTLYRNHIPFRYESELPLEDEIFYPDVTAYSRKKHAFLQWEHAGLMDNPLYAARMQHKLQVYQKNGYLLMQNLIVTTETKDAPLDPYLVQELVRIFFLDDEPGSKWME